MENNIGIVKRILLFIGCMFLALIIMTLGECITHYCVELPFDIIMNYCPVLFSFALVTGVMYLRHIGLWIAIVACLANNKKNRPILQEFGRKPSGNTFKKFWLGILTGFLLNGICVLIASVRHDISLEYMGFRPISLILIFLCVLVQSSAEEALLRGYLYQKAMQYFKYPAVAFILNSLLFAVLHLFNDGVTLLSVINIFLLGMFFSLLVYYMDSIWCAFAVHTAWNFTQNILFGLPNSGIVVPYCVFQLNKSKARDSFAYSTSFGIEGTVTACLVLVIACSVLFLWGRRKGKKGYDVWNDGENEQERENEVNPEK